MGIYLARQSCIQTTAWFVSLLVVLKYNEWGYPYYWID
jgi:hypothetical protein